MKLTELITEYHHDDYDDRHDDRYDDSDDGTGSFTIEEYDGLQPADAVVSMFGIEVEYGVADQGHTDHPYGSTSAREYHGVEVEIISAKTTEEVTYHHPETDEVLKTFPEGTDVDKLPGWGVSDWDFLQQKAEEHA